MVKQVEVETGSLLSLIDHVPIDRGSILQDRLDLANRHRTSFFPWRGQFSPELVELLLREHASPKSVVLDPFVGSGTTLFEAAAKFFTCFGAEINPAAFEMARTVHFANLPLTERDQCIERAEAIIRRHLTPPFQMELFAVGKCDGYRHGNALTSMISETSDNPFIQNLVVNVIIRHTALRRETDSAALLDALNIQKAAVRSLPYSENTCRVFHCDARSVPLEGATVDVVITSPPYINVFNYHQNYRKIMELLGWNLLRVARSEIGSNRKNRGNRFLTVIQYAIDIFQALMEIRRLVRPDGRVLIIIGRESSVRGISFRNGQILTALAWGAGLRLALRQERKFVTRFGEKIYEDILHFTPDAVPHLSGDFARSLGVAVLGAASVSARDDVRQEIKAAMREANSVHASPLFEAAHAMA